MCFYPVCLILTAAISDWDASLSGLVWPNPFAAMFHRGKCVRKRGVALVSRLILIIKPRRCHRPPVPSLLPLPSFIFPPSRFSWLQVFSPAMYLSRGRGGGERERQSPRKVPARGLRNRATCYPNDFQGSVLEEAFSSFRGCVTGEGSCCIALASHDRKKQDLEAFLFSDIDPEPKESRNVTVAPCSLVNSPTPRFKKKKQKAAEPFLTKPRI